VFRIRHVDHIVLRVVDIEAMLRFYLDVLGCSMGKVQEGPGLYQVRVGSSMIDLIPVDGKLGRQGGAGRRGP
jgi:catechol 2,3-dioxygenase-like lactoylglutathione lyase family enzyme